MSDKKRVEYVQPIGDEWQPATAALSAAIIVIGLVTMFYSPVDNRPQGQMPSVSDDYGQIRQQQAPLQQSVDTTQRSTAPVTPADGGGLQSAGSAENYQQFQGGSL